jgi:hypothetical protein
MTNVSSFILVDNLQVRMPYPMPTIWPLFDIIYFRTMASEDDAGGVDWINFNA